MPEITILNSDYPDIKFSASDTDGTVESVEILTKSASQSEYYSRRTYTAEEAESEMTFAIYSHYFDEGINEVKIIATDNEGATTEEILTYNTYDLFNIDYFPTDETDTGVVEIGATVNLPIHYDSYFMSVYQSSAQPTDRQFDITVEIADNSDYIDSITYNSNDNNNGDTAIIQHAMVNAGDYYIKINITDSKGWQAEEIEYVLTVIEIFYFLEEPQIERGAMQANSITVKSDTAEYTATTDPPPSADELIETEISIEEGDEATCQAVAEKLIEKWGKEPLTITGPVNLTVTLKFKEKIRIVIPTNEIDDYFIVQKKTHYVTENTTEIVAGDIMLDENELLARILSEME